MEIEQIAGGPLGEKEIGGRYLGDLDDIDFCAGKHHRGKNHIVIGTTEGVGLCLSEAEIRAIIRVWRRRPSRTEGDP